MIMEKKYVLLLVILGLLLRLVILNNVSYMDEVIYQWLFCITIWTTWCSKLSLAWQ